MADPQTRLGLAEMEPARMADSFKVDNKVAEEPEPGSSLILHCEDQGDHRATDNSCPVTTHIKLEPDDDETHGMSVNMETPSRPHPNIKHEQDAAMSGHCTNSEAQPCPSFKQELNVAADTSASGIPSDCGIMAMNYLTTPARSMLQKPAVSTVTPASFLAGGDSGTETNFYSDLRLGVNYPPASEPGSQQGAGEKSFDSGDGGISDCMAGSLHKQAGNRLHCEKCDSSFCGPGELKRHMRKHTGEKPFECDECGASFTRLYILKTHQRKHTGEKPFQCEKCDESFSSSQQLKAHTYRHAGKLPFQCGECGACYRSPGELKNHIMFKHTGEKPFQCKLCGSSFAGSSALSRHMRKHTGLKPYRCGVCGASFTRPDVLKGHQRIHTEEKTLECKECGESFADSGSLKLHCKHTHPNVWQEEVAVSSDCSDSVNLGRKFRSSSKQDLNVTTSASGILSDRVVMTRNYLRTPKVSMQQESTVSVHAVPPAASLAGRGDSETDTNMYADQQFIMHFPTPPEFGTQQDAGVCVTPASSFAGWGSGTKESDHLDQQLGATFPSQATTSSSSEPDVSLPVAKETTVYVKCEPQETEFEWGGVHTHSASAIREMGDGNQTDSAKDSIYANLDVGMLSDCMSGSVQKQTGKPFHCEECGSSFCRSGQLRRHMRKHTGEKPFACDECGASFTRLYILKTHQREHTGEKPFICEECDASFSSSQQLKAHMYKHTGKLPFQCGECGASYRSPGELKSHMLKHTGEKPFQCKVCGSSFVRSSALSRHMRKHTGKKPFSCGVCGASFSRADVLKVHERTHTEEKPRKECQESFADCGTLQLHMYTHHSIKQEEDAGCSVSVDSETQSQPNISQGDVEVQSDCSDSVDFGSKLHTSFKQEQNVVVSSSASGILAGVGVVTDNYLATPTLGMQQEPAVSLRAFTPASSLTGVSVVRETTADVNSDSQETDSGWGGVHNTSAVTETGEGHSGTNMTRADSAVDFSTHIYVGTGEKSLETEDHTTTDCMSGSLPIQSGKKPFVCGECAACFGDLEQLKSHVHEHREIFSIECGVCGVSCRTPAILKRHMIRHTGEKPFVCQECGASFHQSGNLKVHLRIHTGEKPFRCEDCGATFRVFEALKTHKLKHTGKKPFLCDECGSSFLRPHELRKHTLKHIRDKKHACGICGVSFRRLDALRKHKREHTRSKKPVQCEDTRSEKADQCGKHNCKDTRTEKPVQCEKHKHEDTRSEKADQCGKHKRKRTRNEKPVQCEECGAFFSSAGNLRQHMRIHSGQKPHECAQCGAAFVAASTLRKHARRHTGEKPYQCEQCGKSFAFSFSLTKHMRSHTGEKPYECGKCGATFTSNNAMKEHTRKHTGERPFICGECGASFARSKCLIEHKRLHTGEKPFECGTCGKRCRTTSNLRVHQRTHRAVKQL